MLSFSSIASGVALFVALMIPGFALGKMKRIEAGAIKTLGNLLSDIAMPALVFVKLIQTDITRLDPWVLAICILLPAVIIFALHFITKLLMPRRDDGKEHLSARFCAMFSNCGFLGIPLAAALFPNAPEVTVYVSLANVTNTFLLLTLGVGILSDRRGSNPKEMLMALMRPVTFAMILGAICSVAGLGTLAPSVVSYSDTLAQLTTPLSMTVLGFELSRLSLKSLFCDARVYIASAIRLLLSPLLAFSILVLLRYAFGVNVPYTLFSAMLIVTAVSTAASASAMSLAHGIKGNLAACATLMSTLLCVITLPLLWMLLGAAFV